MNYKINYVPSFGKDLKKLSRKYRSIKKDYENLLKILSINEPLYKNDDVTLLAIYSKSEIENIDENKI